MLLELSAGTKLASTSTMVPPPTIEQERCLPFKISWNYYRSMWAYCIFCSMIGAIAIFAIDGLPFVDCLFLAVSAYTGSGLISVGAQSISNGSFAVIFVLMFLGGTIFLLLPPIVWRIQSFRALEPTIEMVLASIEHMTDSPRVTNLLGIVSTRRAQIRGLLVVLIVVVLYLMLWLLVGWWVLWIVLSQLDPLPELQQRGFGNAWVSSFTVLSAYANAGYTMASDSLLGWREEPSVYLPISLLILAGNNFAPIFLRGLLHFVHMQARRLGIDEAGARFALDHPRQMTTHLFDRRQTKILFWLLVVINMGQYVIYLAATLSNRPLPDSNTPGHAAGAGICQTVSTRMAGFTIVSLSELNMGLLVMYLVMMYLSVAPFVSRMYVSEETFDDEDNANGWKKTTASAEAAQSRFNALFLFRHLSWLGVVFALIAFMEDKFMRSAYAEDVTGTSLFGILFEIISAYGNVGLSLGFKSEAYSLSGAFTTPSKILIITVMMLGKHRGLPAVTDITLNFQYVRLRKALLYVQDAQSQHERRCSLHDITEDFDEAKVVRQALGISSPTVRPTPAKMHWSKRWCRKPEHTAVSFGQDADEDEEGVPFPKPEAATLPQTSPANDHGYGVGAGRQVRIKARPVHVAIAPGEDGQEQGEGTSQERAGERAGLQRIATLLRERSVVPRRSGSLVAQTRPSGSFSNPRTSTSSWGWRALWSPEEDETEAQQRVQAWELLQSDHLMNNIFSGELLHAPTQGGTFNGTSPTRDARDGSKEQLKRVSMTLPVVRTPTALSFKLFDDSGSKATEPAEPPLSLHIAGAAEPDASGDESGAPDEDEMEAGAKVSKWRARWNPGSCTDDSAVV